MEQVSAHHTKPHHTSRKQRIVHHLHKEKTHEIIYMIVIAIAAIIAFCLIAAAHYPL